MAGFSMQPVIWWIRKDLRLKDNQALEIADPENRIVIPVFIMDPNLLKREAEKRKVFLFNGLRSLDEGLRASGSRLIIRAGNPEEELSRLVKESGATGIFAEEDYTPYARRRDQAVAENLPLNLLAGLTFHHPRLVSKPDGSPYTVFTPYSKAWKKLPQPSAVRIEPARRFMPVPGRIQSLAIPDAIPVENFPSGEDEAERRLRDFLAGRVSDYREARNRLDVDGTSSLSPYFRFGILSSRYAVLSVLDVIRNAPNSCARAGAETWLNELIWREFYQSILYHFPDVSRKAFRADLRGIEWNHASEKFSAWKSGATGYPVVDASMRQLATLGWMHNRGRMITASFLVKDLLVNWQEGEEWFMRQLIDGDPASNNGGWQWIAGVGTDAAPYFRIFNPVLQGKKFDPEGTFIRKWIPELANVTQRYIHEPWTMPVEEQRKAGCVVGEHYPLPVVDHIQARERTLEAYKRSKDVLSGS